MHGGYMSGFNNEFETEALPGALPRGQNSPQRCPYGLYAEQLSGTPFTAPHGVNARSWLYRIRPSVKHTGTFRSADVPFWKTAPHIVAHGLPLGQLRWDPLPIPNEPLTFVGGVRTMTTAGDVRTHTGMAAHVFHVTQSMEDDYFVNADGEMLIVPQTGRLSMATELGRLSIGLARSPSSRAGSSSRPESKTALRTAICARIMASGSPCLRAGRLAPIASPIRAILRRRPQASRKKKRPAALWSNGAAHFTSAKLTIRRSTSSPGMEIMCPINTISAPSRLLALSFSITRILRSSRS